jgi:hypothetical protein
MGMRRRWPLLSITVLAGALTLCVSCTAQASVAIVAPYGMYYDGVYGPRHSLTLVDVTNEWMGTSNFHYACENALNGDGSGTWAQDHDYCATNPGPTYVYHTFCGCRLRLGFNVPSPEAEGVIMFGNEYY